MREHHLFCKSYYTQLLLVSIIIRVYNKHAFLIFKSKKNSQSRCNYTMRLKLKSKFWIKYCQLWYQCEISEALTIADHFNKYRLFKASKNPLFVGYCSGIWWMMLKKKKCSQ